MAKFIRHNVYLTGVQSLGFALNGVDYTLGIIPPGYHDHGLATRRETVKVVAGSLTVRHAGGRHQVLGPSDDAIIFEPNDPIQLTTNEGAAYVCIYGPRSK